LLEYTPGVCGTRDSRTPFRRAERQTPHRICFEFREYNRVKSYNAILLDIRGEEITLEKNRRAATSSRDNVMYNIQTRACQGTKREDLTVTFCTLVISRL